MEQTETEQTPEREDTEYLINKIEATHFNPYLNVNREDFINSLNKAEKENNEFFPLAIQESLALIRDAHTYVKGILNNDYLPFECKEFEGHFYIIGSSNNYNHIIGHEILKINECPLNEIFSQISKLSSKENKEVLLGDLSRYLSSNKILRYYNLSNSNSVKLTTNNEELDIKTDSEQKIKIKQPLKWKMPDKNDPTYAGNNKYHFRLINNNLLFQYNECTNEGHTKEELKTFKNKLLNSAQNVDNIIVDLRKNRGGNTEVMEDLFEKLPNNKKIYVAIGRRTFSSAMHHLLFLKQEKGAVLIGENAGQKPNRFGDYKEIVLPNSKLRIACSFQYFELMPNTNIDVIEPDIKIPVTIDDYINETDPLNRWIVENL